MRTPFARLALALALSLIAVGVSTAQDEDRPPGVDDLLEERRRRDETVWAPEVAAQEHEATFTALWDALLASDDPYAVLAAFAFRTIVVGRPGATTAMPWGIGRTAWTAPDEVLDRAAALARLRALGEAGFRIEQTEWHHAEFEPATADRPARSVVSARVDALRPAGEGGSELRVAIKARLRIEWTGAAGSDGRPTCDRIAIDDLVVLERAGRPAFEPIADLSLGAALGRDRPTPVLVRDLDGDGRPEVVLAGINRVFRNEGAGSFHLDRLTEAGGPVFDAAVLADVTGDGRVDHVVVGADRRLAVHPGDGSGRFGRPFEAADVVFDWPKVITTGDVDGDGDLDLFVGQYKFPYRQGTMPTPFYDANDGYPAYLLVNDGRGRFTDATEAAGLGARRFRRTYSASLVDLDDDRDLDLIVVSDFSGVDAYAGDGRGRFEDVTGAWFPERHNFGMAHALADFDLDGRLDAYVIGMSSTTARRLEALGLGPEGQEEITRMRMAMGYGNRLYLRRAAGPGFDIAPWNEQVARTGWSWGTTAFDFDLDGDDDLYVANGHTSGSSTQDYCTSYWRHDIYQGDSKPDEAHLRLFQDSLSRLTSREISWNGYEHNQLLLNDAGGGFTDVAWLLGVAFEFDSRSVVGADLDLDGRPDLIVLQFLQEPGAGERFQIHGYRNVLETGNHWLGVRLAEDPSPVGARIVVESEGGRRLRVVVDGDSYSAQHPPVGCFGLGAASSVRSLEVRWADGRSRRVEGPAVDRYHLVAPE